MASWRVVFPQRASGTLDPPYAFDGAVPSSLGSTDGVSRLSSRTFRGRARLRRYQAGACCVVKRRHQGLSKRKEYVRRSDHSQGFCVARGCGRIAAPDQVATRGAVAGTVDTIPSSFSDQFHLPDWGPLRCLGSIGLTPSFFVAWARPRRPPASSFSIPIQIWQARSGIHARASRSMWRSATVLAGASRWCWRDALSQGGARPRLARANPLLPRIVRVAMLLTDDGCVVASAERFSPF
jgi:hypothetical protein